LRRLGLRPASSGEAAACVVLAARLDATEGAAVAPNCARELRLALGAIAAAAQGRGVPGLPNTTGLDPGDDLEMALFFAELSRN